jgi:glycosyltransferase involved in cell wall biosynthesis
MHEPKVERPLISVIVPAYNAAATIERCLGALMADADTEILVVDDGSTDDTARLAVRLGARVLPSARNGGTAAARNHGVRHSSGTILMFVDADVKIAAGTISRFRRYFSEHPDCDAVIGSYDTAPAEPNIVSQYVNLMHHYYHQSSPQHPSHFWGGLGAVRRTAFEAIGGYDARILWIEDVELGYRLRRAGHDLRIDKGLCGTHLKHFSLSLMIKTDFWLRAVPWTRFLVTHRVFPSDFALSWTHRFSVMLAWLAVSFVILGLFLTPLLWAALVCAVSFLAVNHDVIRFFQRQRGTWFAARIVPLHFLRALISGAAVMYCLGAAVLQAKSPGLAAKTD